jgi:hypothetical protein
MNVILPLCRLKKKKTRTSKTTFFLNSTFLSARARVRRHPPSG